MKQQVLSVIYLFILMGHCETPAHADQTVRGGARVFHIFLDQNKKTMH